jgi:tetratricopeptide (TPR) repeat protein
MTEAGGTTTWSGIAFQSRVAVYHLVNMLHDRALHSDDPIISVRVEAPESVDDILVTKESGIRIFQSVKESIKRENGPHRPWHRMWKTIAHQVLFSDFDVNRDIIQIVFPEKTALVTSIRDLTTAARTSFDRSELTQRSFSQAPRELLRDLPRLLEISDDQTFKILSATRVRIVGDEDALYEQIMNLLATIWSAKSEDRLIVLDALIHLVLSGAEERLNLDLRAVGKCFAGRDISMVELTARSFSLIQEIAGETTPFDAQRFFRGFPASWPLIRDDVAVSRTCYENGKKKSILTEAIKLDTSGKLRSYLIVGPRGVGKTTLAKRIAVDLSCQGHLVCWTDEYPGRLHSGMVPELRRAVKPEHRAHVFAKVGLPGSHLRLISADDRILNDLTDFIRAFRHSRLTLYLTIDSNHYEVLKEALEDVLLDDPEILTVPLNLDTSEIDLLIKQLRRWGALGSLQGREDSEIRQVFRRKAHKILLASLIEATAGRDERDNFKSILLREYNSLPDAVQPAYPLVALGHSFNVLMPSSLFFSSLRNLQGGGNVTLGQLRTSLAGVVAIQGNWIKTRHSLIALTLCKALDMNVTSSPEGTLWMPLFRAIFKSVDEQDDEHKSYLHEVGSSRVVSILSTSLNDLAEEIAFGKVFRNLTDSSRGLVLNSIARTFQSRNDIELAAHWAEKSLTEVWKSESNGARIVLMYCYLSIRNTPGALALADQIVRRPENPRHLLHGIRVLGRWGHEPQLAQQMLEAHKDTLRNLPGFGQVRGELLRSSVDHEQALTDDNPWVAANWVHQGLELGQIEAEEAIAWLSDVLDQEPNIHRALTDICHLLFLEKHYDDVIRLCDKVIATAEIRSELNKQRHSGTEINPTATKSMALATQAWAIFLREGVVASNTVELLFQQSLELKSNNYWAHNWRGLFLHATKKASGLAEGEIKRAIDLYKRVPPFYRNLAKVILETNVTPFSRSKNLEVIRLCESGLRLCPRDSYWNWGGLRAELEALLYSAQSLEVQNVPNNTPLVGDPFGDMELSTLE